MGTSQNRNAPSSFVLVGKEGLGAFSYGTPILRHSHICNSKIPPATPQGGWKGLTKTAAYPVGLGLTVGKLMKEYLPLGFHLPTQQVFIFG